VTPARASSRPVAGHAGTRLLADVADRTAPDTSELAAPPHKSRAWLKKRDTELGTAYGRHPERFVRKRPEPSALPVVVV
jgi:hypothetical protein